MNKITSFAFYEQQDLFYVQFGILCAKSVIKCAILRKTVLDGKRFTQMMNMPNYDPCNQYEWTGDFFLHK